MRQLEVPGKWLLVLALGGGVYKDALEVECGCLGGLVGRNFHREEAVGSTLGRVERRVTATDDNLGRGVSIWMPRDILNVGAGRRNPDSLSRVSARQPRSDL